MITRREFQNHLRSLRLPAETRQCRQISLLSAAIAVGNNDLTGVSLVYLKEQEIPKQVIYETLLQSYLFLGFPRMIEAALVFNEVFGDYSDADDIEEILPEEVRRWYDDGIALCRTVYGRNYDRLKRRFLSISPDLFRWMVLEGYGKVLSRPGLTQVERELAEVAALIVDGRERQLISHVMGSLNVGAPVALLRQVNDDIHPLSGDDHHGAAEEIIADIEGRYAPD